nr:hypothetical protein [Tahibacter harae]
MPPDASVREVKRRYSQLLKLNRPEDNPQGFQQLRAAYEICLRLAQQREAGQASAAEPSAAAPADETAPTTALPAETPEQAAAARRRAAQTRTAAPPPHAAAAGVDAEPITVLDEPPAPSQPGPRPPPFHLEDAPPPAPHRVNGDPPGAAPPPLIDSDPPPAPPHPVNAERIGKFLPVDIVPPVMREPAAVVDELLQLDGNDETLVERWFARCPELMNFTRRDAVELELLRRIAAGAQPGMFVLQRAGSEFGWRDLSFPRRLAAQGISGAQWQAVENALHESFAQAEFQAHLRSAQKLQAESAGPKEENYLLRQLHSRRGRRPALREAFSGRHVLKVNNLLYAYAERYGGRALFHVFGPELLDFWRSVHPNVAPNWTRFLLAALRIFAYGGALWLILLVIVGLDHDLQVGSPRLPEHMLTLSLSVFSVLLVLVGYVGAQLAFLHFREKIWQRFLHWRERQLERYVEPWLKPARALPLLLGITALGLLADHLLGNGASALLMAVLALLLFGFSGMISLLPAGLLLAMALLLWEPRGPLWLGAGAGGTLGLLWLGDRLARRKQAAQSHWERRFIHVLLLSVLLCAVSFGVKLGLAT